MGSLCHKGASQEEAELSIAHGANKEIDVDKRGVSADLGNQPEGPLEETKKSVEELVLNCASFVINAEAISNNSLPSSLELQAKSTQRVEAITYLIDQGAGIEDLKISKARIWMPFLDANVTSILRLLRIALTKGSLAKLNLCTFFRFLLHNSQLETILVIKEQKKPQVYYEKALLSLNQILVQFSYSKFIERTNICDEGAKEIGAALQKNTTLTTLNLCIPFIICNSQLEAVLAIKEQKKLELHCRKIPPLLNQILVQFSYLQLIGGNYIGNEGVKGIGIALQKNTTLTTLNLCTLFILYNSQLETILTMKEQKKQDFYCKQMPPSLTQTFVRFSCYNQQVETILVMKEQKNSELHCKRISLLLHQVSVHFLVVTIYSCKQYQLCRSKRTWNCIAKQYCSHCIKSLCIFYSLQSIATNNIGDDGAKEFGTALQNNTSLTTLNLCTLSIFHNSQLETGLVLKELEFY
eukprot:TRINITY_DN2326_c0_g1_i6.p1 TRINITY_DN2326_c0_g1~~TRINITY_DN2326_c0_g1_i6.p1  ORF type:complete len:467 (+),score=-0.30 TRINITY_DN2326_c0_g1_i6:690-2090(+)